MSQAIFGRLEDLPGAFGRYRVLKLLGQGGMGAVYLAQDTQLDRPVALKIPNFDSDAAPEARERFQREARAAATILHPNVCPLHDVGEIDGVPYLTMGYIEGRPLTSYIGGKPLPQKNVGLLVRKLALALAEAHKHGVIHRDLKPGNIIIDKRNEPIIMDFGLARRTRKGDVRLTQKGATMGTPAYMPPEQVSGDVEAMGPACDIYSLGVILYELLAGRLPFTGDVMAMLSKVLLDEPPPPSQFRDDIDPKLEAICLKAMSKKISDRYSSMNEMAAALLDCLRGMAGAGELVPVTAAGTSAKSDSTETRLEEDSRITKKGEGRRTAKESRRRRKVRKQTVPVWAWIAGGAGAATALVITLILILSGGGNAGDNKITENPGGKPPIEKPPGKPGGADKVADLGTIQIEPSEPAAGLELKVDGESRPWNEPLRLKPGEHQLDMTGKGYAAIHEKFFVQPGINPAHRVVLVKLPPAELPVTIEIVPSEAVVGLELRIDGELRTWNKTLLLKPGEHILEAKAKGFVPIKEKFAVVAGANPPHLVALVKLPIDPPVQVEGVDPRVVKLDGTVNGSMAWSPDGKLLAIPVFQFLDADGKSIEPGPGKKGRYHYSVQIWDIGAGRRFKSLDKWTWSISALGFSSDSSTVVIAYPTTKEKKLEFWSLETGSLKNTVTLDLKTRNYALAPDCKTLVVWQVAKTIPGKKSPFPSGTTVYKAQLRDASTGEVLKELAHTYVATSPGIPGFGENNGGSLAFSADGKMLATADNAKAVLWSIPDGNKIRDLKGWKRLPQTGGLSFSGTGRTLFRVGFSINAWDVQTGDFKGGWKDIQSAGGGVERQFWNMRALTSPKGSLVALTGLRKAKNGADVSLWNPTTGKFLRTWSRTNYSFEAFAPDGKTLAIGFPDRTVKLFALDDGKAGAKAN